MADSEFSVFEPELQPRAKRKSRREFKPSRDLFMVRLSGYDDKL
jgi:hypothetical protein